MRLGQIFAVCAFTFIEVGHRIETKAVDSQVQPKIANLLHQIVHGGIIEIQIWLVRIETVPVIGFSDWIPGPIRSLEIFENDARVFVFFRRITPNIHFPLS